MTVKDYYESQAEVKQTGSDIDGRITKAADIYMKHLHITSRLLDIGCGVGDVGVFLKTKLKAKEVYGIEISEQRVKAAREKGIKAVLHDLNKGSLPFADNYFDAIFCGEVIEHLVDPDQLLDEIRRVLSQEGICIITTPGLGMWYNRIALLFGWQPFDTAVSYKHEVGRPKFLVSDYGCRDHLRVFTYRALKELLALHEFKIIDVRGVSISEVFFRRGEWSKKSLRDIIFRIISPLDTLLSLNPSLAPRIVCAIKKV